MGSESTESAGDRVEIPTRKTVGKAPRKVHKAAREKQKRASMNELFMDLGKAIDVDDQNNGKASMLRETIRLPGELATQMDALKEENATLLSEYNYITSEKTELLEETLALDSHVKELQREIDERARASQSTTQLPETTAPIVGPVFVVPLHHESFIDMDAPKVTSGLFEHSVLNLGEFEFDVFELRGRFSLYISTGDSNMSHMNLYFCLVNVHHPSFAFITCHFPSKDIPWIIRSLFKLLKINTFNFTRDTKSKKIKLKTMSF